MDYEQDSGTGAVNDTERGGSVGRQQLPADATPRAPKRVRRTYDRRATEAALLAGARELLRRDGVLAGLNLREVADVAGVNRGLVYRYFGSRREILRAALAEMSRSRIHVIRERPRMPFRQRRRQVFEQALHRRNEIQLAAMLALDGEDNLGLFPALEEAKQELLADVASGELPADADALVMHALTAATYLGYCVFREGMATELGVEPDELDRRVLDVFSQMLEGFTTPPPFPGKASGADL